MYLCEKCTRNVLDPWWSKSLHTTVCCILRSEAIRYVLSVLLLTPCIWQLLTLRLYISTTSSSSHGASRYLRQCRNSEPRKLKLDMNKVKLCESAKNASPSHNYYIKILSAWQHDFELAITNWCNINLTVQQLQLFELHISSFELVFPKRPANKSKFKCGTPFIELSLRFEFIHIPICP